MPEFGVRQASSTRLNVLVKLVARLASDGARSLHVLEVGSYEGESALFWSRSVGELLPDGGSVTCVDPWLPYYSQQEAEAGEGYRRMAEDLASGEAHRRFGENIREAHPRAPIRAVRATLADALELAHAPRAFGIVYVDGNHRLSAVSRDLALAQPLVLPGGYLCGDDLERQLQDFGPVEVQAARENAEFDYYHEYHPGVTLAVDAAFGRVWSEHGVWAVRRSLTGQWEKELEL